MDVDRIDRIDRIKEIQAEIEETYKSEMKYFAQRILDSLYSKIYCLALQHDGLCAQDFLEIPEAKEIKSLIDLLNKYYLDKPEEKQNE